MHLIPASPDSWFFIALGMCQHVEKMKDNILPKGSHRWSTVNKIVITAALRLFENIVD